MTSSSVPDEVHERLVEGLGTLDSGLLAVLAPVEIAARTEHHLVTARYEGQGANADAEPISVTLWLDDPFAPIGRVVISSAGEEHALRPPNKKALEETFVELAQGSLLPLPPRHVDLSATRIPGATGVQVFGLEDGD